VRKKFHGLISATRHFQHQSNKRTDSLTSTELTSSAFGIPVTNKRNSNEHHDQTSLFRFHAALLNNSALNVAVANGNSAFRTSETTELSCSEKIKENWFLCLIKYHATKIHGGVEEELHALTSGRDRGGYSALRSGRFATGTHWI
jgi:hypothetical protein